MSAVGISDIIDAVQTLVGAQLQITFGKKGKSVNVSPPYVYVFPLTEHYSAPQGPGASANPRAYYTRRIVTEWHCWGVDYGGAEDVSQAIITAARKVMQGAAIELGESTWRDTENMEAGQMIVVPITFIGSLTEAALPFDNSGNDATKPTVVVNTIGPDTTGLSPNTGTPYWGETQ